MIDKSKNLVYIITIHYYIKTEGGLKKQEKIFTSNHGISSKRFYKWMKEKMNEIPNFAFLCEEYGEQYTLPKGDHCF